MECIASAKEVRSSSFWTSSSYISSSSSSCSASLYELIFFCMHYFYLQWTNFFRL
jgi:hypothetical protein